MDIREVVNGLMTEGKGILFASEGTAAENERLARFGVLDEAARRAFRELLFTTPGIEAHLSGVVLSPEAAHEKTKDGTPFPAFLASKGVRSGIFLADADEKKLPDAIREYELLGISFAMFSIGAAIGNEPISDAFEKDIRTLATAASICQREGFAPLLAIDVPGYGTHTAEQAEDAILETLSLLADAFKKDGVDPSRLIVGVSLAASGEGSSVRADAEEVADRTARAAATALSEHTGGVVFLSDTEGPEEATANLNALARLEPLPWLIAFCFSRALLDPVLSAWKGSDEHFADAQAVFESRLALLSEADAAGYSETFETPLE
jgi:fructose-bisphosphate aldolase class I